MTRRIRTARQARKARAIVETAAYRLRVEKALKRGLFPLETRRDWDDLWQHCTEEALARK